MITTLTDQFLIARDRYLRIKKELVEFPLFFVNVSKPNKLCILCSGRLEKAHGLQNDLHAETLIHGSVCSGSCSIEDRLCKFCIEKLHSKNHLFCLRLLVPEEYVEIQRFVENICGIGSTFCIEIEKLIGKRSSIEYINDVFCFLKDEYDKKTSPCNQTALDYSSLDCSLIANYKEKLKDDNIKRLINNQIQFKIRIFEEQLESLRRNYTDAVMSGKFDDSNALRNMFFRIFESKIRLEEKLGGLL
ncbi:uncharacterized protein VICG_00925 [Vittaforma corneae ATCC 50505]|uniref:Uncharacterized protein n=1 Tax=Vittaforma corneae (strain ATCC 50505) TaxID=993615 RepID=L2GML4_VITCO|nr:uncharacterized protein VICG_00925 [Vittaforma corneae ATCC 50505]ELA42076.1 hypothetical protein VICG_00925 [Vittaforma corneae ATCC 50505]